MQYVRTISFSMILNGAPWYSFTTLWGLWQGDPLFTYLFLLVFEVLSLNIIHASHTRLVQCIKLSKYFPGLSYIIFFFEEPLELPYSWIYPREILSGLGKAINYKKSSLYFSTQYHPIQKWHVEISSASGLLIVLVITLVFPLSNGNIGGCVGLCVG